MHSDPKPDLFRTASPVSSSIPIAVIIAAPLVLFGSLLTGGGVLFWGTPILQFYEWRLLAVEAYRAGHFPLWNQMLGCGAPLLANLQSAALYPLNVIYFVFPIERAMGYSVVIHVILAGLFMYGFAREIGLGRLAGLVASLGYMLSGFLIGRVQFLSMVNAAPWLPLLFWLAYRVMRRRKLPDALLLGLAIAVQLLAGHAQLWFYSLCAIGLYVVFLGGGKVLQSLRIGRLFSDPTAWQAYLSWSLIIAALAVAVLAAAGQILPTAEMTRFSQRSEGADYDFAMNYSFWPWRLITLFSPDFFGNPAHGDFWGYGNYWEDSGYIGLLPFLLGLAAIVIWFRRRKMAAGPLKQVPFFAILCVAALLLATGKNLPLYPLVWRYAPGFGFFQAPSRLLYWYTFGIVVLAGIGIQYIGTSECWARLSRYLIAISLYLLLTVGIGWMFLAGATKLTFLGALTRTAILAAGSGALILLNTRWTKPPLRNVWNTLVAGFVVIDLLIFAWPLNPTTHPEVYHLVTDSGTFLREQSTGDAAPFRLFSFHRFYHDTMFKKFFSFKDFGPTDTGHLRELREMLFPNLPVIEGLDSANNYDPLVVGNHQDLLDYIEELPQSEAFKLLGLMNVGYVAGDRETAEGDPEYSGEIDLFENPGFLPRAFVVYQSKVISENDDMLEYMAGDDFDPSREVLLSAPGEAKSVPEEGDTSLTPASLRYKANSVTIDVTLKQNGYLVLTDTYYPSWRVWVDGEERSLLRANYNFRAVVLSPGEHQVIFRYEPFSFKLGVAIGGITWLCVIAGWVVLKLRK